MFDDILVSLLILLGLTLLVIIPNIKIVRADEVSIIERLGKYLKTLEGPGIFFIVPLIDRSVEVIHLGKKTLKATIQMNEENQLTYQVTYLIKDPKAFCYITLDAEKDFKKDLNDLFLAENYALITLTLLNEYAEPYGIEIIDYVIL